MKTLLFFLVLWLLLGCASDRALEPSQNPLLGYYHQRGEDKQPFYAVEGRFINDIHEGGYPIRESEHGPTGQVVAAAALPYVLGVSAVIRAKDTVVWTVAELLCINEHPLGAFAFYPTTPQHDPPTGASNFIYGVTQMAVGAPMDAWDTLVNGTGEVHVKLPILGTYSGTPHPVIELVYRIPLALGRFVRGEVAGLFTALVMPVFKPETGPIDRRPE
jgi:hypothetical protein